MHFLELALSRLNSLPSISTATSIYYLRQWCHVLGYDLLTKEGMVLIRKTHSPHKKVRDGLKLRSFSFIRENAKLIM